MKGFLIFDSRFLILLFVFVRVISWIVARF